MKMVLMTSEEAVLALDLVDEDNEDPRLSSTKDGAVILLMIV